MSMMTSTSTCSGYPSPSPSPGSSNVEDKSSSVRVAKRPLMFSNPASTADASCKKRRKQSTPIRISTSTGSDATVAADVSLDIGLSYEGKLGLGLGSTFSSLHSPEPDLDQEADPDADHDPDPDPDPDPNSSTHVKLEHSHSPSISPGIASTISPSLMPVNLSGGQNFSSWLSDVQVTSKTSDWLNTSSTLPIPAPTSTSHNFYAPVPVSTAITRNPSQPPIRIFNPEAYCELCNKEFCNKYFLKTHKANKHRIYSDPPTSDTVNIPVNASIPSYTSVKKTNLPNLSVIDVPVLKTNDMLRTSLPDLMGTFCDLCGKGFSNKTLLKSHKVNFHGITEHNVDTPSTELETAGDLGIDAVSATTITPISVSMHKDERDVDFVDFASVPTNIPATLDKENILFKNDQSKEESLNNQIPIIDQEESLENTLTLNNQQLRERDRERERDNLDFSINRARRLGIMNPEAFCEICCKEYCNKYFLRTHKMKRHGILIPDENSKDNQKDMKLELSVSNNWYQIQTSPLNLIMGEQNTNSSGSCSERKSSPANENECEICGMRFQTLYLAQLHFGTAHAQNKTTNDEFSTSLTANNNDKLAPDSISEDLQKLQTMILQLNDLDVSRVGAGMTSANSGSTLITCTICSKEFENRYYLRAHFLTEHGVLLDSNSLSTEKQFDVDVTSENTTDLHQQQNLESHLHSKSSNSVLDKKDDSNGFTNSEKPARNSTGNNTNGTGNTIGSERRSSVTMTPANSYCEICNKELCNKYFMKTHMQRMHGIEIENGAQIGGVVCNICNKELCSKYFLRVHKHNTHGIVQDNVSVSSNTNQIRQPNVDLDQQGTGVGVGSAISANVDISNNVPDPALKLGELSDLNNRYFTHFTEVCSICSRRFRSTKWLKAHLLGDHGKVGTEKWTELELQLQQSFGQQSQTQQRKANNSVGDSSSPTLRIPNGGQDNTKTENDIQNVLSNIFGTNESNVKQYHCSFCSFSTPILAFLFVHERSHSHTRGVGVNVNDVPAAAVTATNNISNTGTVIPSNTIAISSSYCAVCNQSFLQPDQLHRHIVTQHAFLSFSSLFGNVRQSHLLPQLQQPQSINNHIEIPVDSLSDLVSNALVDQQQDDHKCSKCTQCERTKKNELSTEVSNTLKNVSTQRQLPATYALPQPQHQHKTKYMMQAFLMDEPNVTNIDVGTTEPDVLKTNTDTVTISDLNTEEDQLSQQHIDNSNTFIAATGAATSSSIPITTDRRFAPSIVFLPVLEKLTAPLTVSFTLTPA